MCWYRDRHCDIVLEVVVFHMIEAAAITWCVHQMIVATCCVYAIFTGTIEEDNEENTEE